MRMLDRITTYRSRKRALKQIADLYIYEVESARVKAMQPLQPTTPAPIHQDTYDPNSMLAPRDPLTESVDQLVRELEIEEQRPAPINSRSAQMNVIKRRL